MAPRVHVGGRRWGPLARVHVGGDVQRYAPEQLDEFDRLLRESLENPKEAQHPDKQGR